jgi:hypothetical protein
MAAKKPANAIGNIRSTKARPMLPRPPKKPKKKPAA